MPPTDGIWPDRRRGLLGSKQHHRTDRSRGRMCRSIVSCLPLALLAMYAAFMLWRLGGMSSDNPAGTEMDAASILASQPESPPQVDSYDIQEVNRDGKDKQNRIADTKREEPADEAMVHEGGSEDVAIADAELAPAAGGTGHISVPGCEDANDSCESWAANGECRNNPKFMAHGCKFDCGEPSGEKQLFGFCQGSCGLCTVPEPKDYTRLIDGRVLMPTIGFGTAGLGPATKEAVTWAWEAGYRHFDSAQAREWYREDLVGEALESILKSQREEVFITSKLHPRHLGHHTTVAQIQTSLADLHTEHLDLFMLHYRECWGNLCGQILPEGTWKDSWRALEELWHSGVLRLIGVSNFNENDLIELLEFAEVKPHVVEANSDPFNANGALQELCRLFGIKFIGYSTLGSQWMMRGYTQNPVLASPIIQGIAKAKHVSEAQIVLRWALQKGQVVIPRSSRQAHIIQNRDLWNFSLSADDMASIEAMDRNIPLP